MEKNSQKGEEPSLIYGKNAVIELLKSGRGTDTLLLSSGMAPAEAAYYAALAKNAGAVVKSVPPSRLRAVCGTESNQGVAAYASGIEYASVSEMLEAAGRFGEDPFILLSDGVEDPHNLGAIIRTALLAGAHGAVIPKRDGAQITTAVSRASAGASMILPVARVANIAETVRRLKEQNVFVYAADMNGAPPASMDLTGPIALVVGSEGSGVSPLVRKLCDGLIGLPMSPRRGGVDSLNVSVAAGILMYEIVRQRRAKQGNGGQKLEHAER